MGAVEHLKTLCCLGLKPESAMIAITPVLHEIIPHGWSRLALIAPDTTWSASYAENPAAAAHYRDRFAKLMEDPAGLGPLYLPALRAAGIGWTLHLQGRGWFDRAWYREIEAPLGVCWILDAMIAHEGRTIALLHLTRPRTDRPFTVEDVQILDRLRPWLAHALRPRQAGEVEFDCDDDAGTLGAPARSGHMILTPGGKLVFESPGLEFLRRILAGEPSNYMRPLPARDWLLPPVQRLVSRLVDAANGAPSEPPRMQISTAYGILTLEAKWLFPAGVVPADAAADPGGCLVSVTIELREHAIAHAARVLRQAGATPAQVRVGVRLAMGKGKRTIASELGIQLSSVMDLTKKLYQSLDIHNSAELGMKIWLAQKPPEKPLVQAPNWAAEFNAAVLRKSAALVSASLRDGR
jgi:hypothetical protein